jgi:hypothetical protein
MAGWLKPVSLHGRLSNLTCYLLAINVTATCLYVACRQIEEIKEKE